MLTLYNSILLTILVCHHLSTYVPMHILGIVGSIHILIALVNKINSTAGTKENWKDEETS
jgi:hypothetical protein